MYAALAVLPGLPGEVEVDETVAQPAVAHGLGGLTAEDGDLTSDLGDDVGDASQVGVDTGQLV